MKKSFAFKLFQILMIVNLINSDILSFEGALRHRVVNAGLKKQKESPDILKKKGELKLIAIEELESKSSNKIIEFTADQYMDLVIQNPRPYDVVMIFSVKQNCPHCEQVYQEFEQLVYSFVKERGVNKDSSKEKKIFFGIFYFQENQEVQKIFMGHGYQNVPFMSISPLNLKRESKLEGFYQEHDQWLMNPNEVFDAVKQIDYVNNHLKTDVQIKFTIQTILMKNFMGFLLIASLFYLVKSSYDFLMNQWVWFVIAISVQIICTGGLVYTMLNGMPFFKYERNEFGAVVVTEYFMRSQNAQWGGEGYIVSVLVAATGISYIILNRADSICSTKQNLRIVTIAMLVSIFILQQLILICYRIKSPWYNPTFEPPGYYQRGSLMSDQGNNI